MQPRIHIWMNFPSHHQSGLFNALRDRGVDLKVTYYQQIESRRLAQGWKHTESMNDWELSLPETTTSPIDRLLSLPDHVHIIPGYGSPILRSLAMRASKDGIKWCHWSEASRAGLRWWLRLPTKKRYAKLVNAHSLGAFGQGLLARQDFSRWGIQTEKMADLFYSVTTNTQIPIADNRIIEFAAGRSVFLFLGRMDSGKAIDIQIEAFKQLNTPDWCMVFVGSGDREKYQAYSKRHGISKQTLFLPPVGWDQVAGIHCAADVLLLPSRYEGWGVVANEAAALSKALILSTACGAAWHLIDPGINGFIVEPGSVHSLCGAMQRYVHGGKELAINHGKESFRISQNFTCEASAKRLLKTLHSWAAQG